MPGVVPALVPDDVVHAVAEQVGRLALALIAPLGANNHDGGHGFRLARPVPGEGSPGRLAGAGSPGRLRLSTAGAGRVAGLAAAVGSGRGAGLSTAAGRGAGLSNAAGAGV